MPRQNRVTPFGDIIATPARGTLMGNRGCLHDASGRESGRASGRLVRTHKPGYNAWIYCLLEFKGRRRELMQPGRYTELFFLDEATALAAGHRPCAECQRGRYNEFMRCWGEANRSLLKKEQLRAPMVDAVIQRERMGKGGEKVKWLNYLGDLPEGAMVQMEAGEAALVVEGGIKRWLIDSYGEREALPQHLIAPVLTPASVVRAIEFGFVPAVN